MLRLAMAMLTVFVATVWASAEDRPRLFGPRRDRVPSPYAPLDCPPPQVWPAPSGPITPLQPGETQPGSETPQPGTGMPPGLDAAQPPASSAFNEALASAGESGTLSGSQYQPGFFGDLIASCIGEQVFIPEQGITRVLCSPNVTQMGAIKFAEGGSPLPMDRVYYNYNYFGGVEVNLVEPEAPLMAVHRHVLGMEKTFLDGDASIGFRLPFFSLGGDSISYHTAFVGDLSLISKFALWNDRTTGNVWSVGLALAVPTGDTPTFLDSQGNRTVEQVRYRPVTFQPFTGYIWNPTPRCYVHGYHAIAVPTDRRDPTFMSNGAGLGYWLYRAPADEFVQGVIPTFEVHVNTPFGKREPTGLGGTLMRDSVNLTMGGYVVMPRSMLGGAVGVPLAFGPHQIEAVATYTLRY